MKKLWAKFMLWWLYNDRHSCEMGISDIMLDKEDRQYFSDELEKVQARIDYYEGIL